ncbi:ArsR family transcriptional regulator [Vibrio neptunius]|uniref:ArsR family transcriptional regulator n=1 Tax=Vibrio neptunius TaxID=170651 RepID=UPI003314617D
MKVSNPLTIIAIFAGLAETLATVALIKLPPEIQSVFVYFVIAFPTLIVCLFFFVLYSKNNVLYAPSDFDDQKHYLESNNIKEQVNLEIEKLFEEINVKGITLTRGKVDKFKANVSASIDKASLPDDLRAIVEKLEKKSLSTTAICTVFRYSKELALLKLKHLEDIGVVKFNSEHMWQICT